ncbi:MAG: OmpA family protein [Paludibacteraceae bacterium]|nr:OmpA family protein [Paludibacteraceae bacterium]
MKKIFSFLMLITFGMNVFAAIDSKYSEGYEFKKTESCKEDESYALSPYKSGTYVFISNGKVYQTRIDTADVDLEPKECPDFAKITPTGLVAYDAKRNRLYYTDRYKEYRKDYLYESKPDANGVWQPGVRMRIRGTVKQRGKKNFVESAGWTFEDDVIGNFYNPAMSPDGNRVYFSSTMDGSKGGRDIFYVEIENEAERVWSYPVNDSLLNSIMDEDWVSFDGDSTIYLSSARKGLVSIYSSQTTPTGWSEPKRMDKPYESSAYDYNLQICQGRPVQVSTRGGKRQLYLHRQIPAEPEPEPTYEEKKRQFYWVFFLFDFDKDILDSRFDAELDSLCKQMRQFPDAKFEISGYTDSRGSDEYNDKLSQRRADTIRDMLIKKGFSPDVLVSIGYGERRLQVPNAQTEEEHAQNRRVEVRIIMEDNK